VEVALEPKIKLEMSPLAYSPLVARSPFPHSVFASPPLTERRVPGIVVAVDAGHQLRLDLEPLVLCACCSFGWLGETVTFRGWVACLLPSEREAEGRITWDEERKERRQEGRDEGEEKKR
jgi:hypothetical protein